MHDLTELFSLLADDHRVGVETNGTFDCPYDFAHISLSPKVTRNKIVLQRCDSLKILFPYYNRATAKDFAGFPASYRCLQPIEKNGVIPYEETIEEVARLGGNWRLGVQLHKLIGAK
jgi:organic radical activating enzyme